MTKAERLFKLLDLLRRRRRATGASHLAEHMNVSTRTIYRDIRSLQLLGVPINGEAGVGYLLASDCFMPPFAFDEDELEALMVGARWVERRADRGLAASAESAIAKIADALSAGCRARFEGTAVFVEPGEPQPVDIPALAVLRAAIRREERLRLQYCDATEQATDRIVWPLAIGFYNCPMLAAWCELRQAFRTFAVERIIAIEGTGTRMDERRDGVFRRYLASFD